MATRPLRHPILLALLLGAAGFAVNLFRFEIFFNVDFIFGSVFAILGILFAGPLVGGGAALVASSATLLLWNHPWGLLIATGEALCVGWLVRRRSWDVLLADLLYWLLLGAPLLWVCYRQGLHTESSTALLIILKQTLNGLVNTLLASLIHKLWRSRWHPEGVPRPAFRPMVFVTLVSLVTFPGLLFLAAFLRREIQHEEQLLVRQSLEMNEVARLALSTWIGDQQQAIASLAALVARTDLSAADRQRATEIVDDASPAFKRVGVMNAKAIVTAYSPRLDAYGQPVIGRDFSDRPYLPILKTTLRPYVSDPVLGRVGPPEPMVPLLAPVVRDGLYAGYCIGITDTNLIREVLRTIAGRDGAQVTLVDRQGHVVASTQPGLRAMTRFHLPQGEVQSLGDGVQHRIPPPQPGHSRMQRWRQSVVVREAILSPDLPWTVVVERPFAPLITTLTRISIRGLGALLVLVLATMALAHALSRAFTQAIAHLEAATRAFPTLLREAPEQRLSLPPSGIEEMHRLTQHFEQMTEALRASFTELSALKDSLEARVIARTAELQAALDAIKTLQGIIPICASCKKIRDDKGAWNQLEAYISAHTEAAFTHGLCPDCVRRLYPELHLEEEKPNGS